MLSVDMGDAPTDRATEAFRRLLSDAAAGGQAKVDALVALSQRTLFVATWTPGSDDFRTLVNSSGQQALPVFSSKAELDEAAGRFGWAGPDGSVPHLEVGACSIFWWPLHRFQALHSTRSPRPMKGWTFLRWVSSAE